MKYLLILSLSVLFIQACTDNKTSRDPIPFSELKGDTTVPTKCYSYTSATDTISMSVILIGESVGGSLEYKLHEKDKNSGTIIGYMKGDILIADYTFMSEGVQSTRQVAFKKQNDYLIEGYGEMIEIDKRMVFTDKENLKFNEKFKLAEVKCE